MNMQRSYRFLFVGMLIGVGSIWPPSPAHAEDAAKLADGGELRFQFSELKAGGVVHCALYNTAKEYMKKSFQEVTGSVAGGRALCIFAHVAAGTYAMAAYHDENSNGKLDTGVFGIPKEGVCSSNNAKGTMGPPKYKDAAFAFSSGSLSQELKMMYR